MNILSKYDDADDMAFRGKEEIAKFIRQNYRKFTIYQLTRMLNITPGVVQDILTDTQLKLCGRRAAHSVVFIRDASTFQEDTKRYNDGCS